MLKNYYLMLIIFNVYIYYYKLQIQIQLAISNGNYYMAINQRNNYYQGQDTYMSIILILDSNLNTHSWITYQPTIVSNDLIETNIQYKLS